MSNSSKFSSPFLAKSPLNQKEYIVTEDGNIPIEGEEISRDEFFHTGPYDYKTTETYLNEMRRVNDSLTNTGDIPREMPERAEYYRGDHKKHSHLFPGRGSLRKYAEMSADEQKAYFKNKNQTPLFPIEE